MTFPRRIFWLFSKPGYYRLLTHPVHPGRLCALSTSSPAHGSGCPGIVNCTLFISEQSADFLLVCSSFFQMSGTKALHLVNEGVYLCHVRTGLHHQLAFFGAQGIHLCPVLNALFQALAAQGGNGLLLRFTKPRNGQTLILP